MRRFLITPALCAALACCGLKAAEPVERLTRCADILVLDEEAASRGIPLEISGVISCYVPESQLCFVQDEAAAVYVWPAPWPKGLKTGDKVVVTGVSGKGSFTPIAQMAAIRPLGSTGKVRYKRGSIEEIQSGKHDAQSVEVDAVVVAQKRSGSHQELTVRRGPSTLQVLLFGDVSPGDLADAEVRLRGVAGTYYRSGRLTGFGLFVSEPSGVEVIQSGGEVFAGRPRAVSDLVRYSPEGGWEHRMDVQGTVIWSEPGTLYVRDDSGTAAVSLADGSAQIAAGTVVRVAGFLKDAAGPLELGWATARETSRTKPPEAKGVVISELLKVMNVHELVRVRGTVRSRWKAEGKEHLLLEDAGNQLVVLAVPVHPRAEAGAAVELEGVLAELNGKRVLKVNPAGVKLIRAASLAERTGGGVLATAASSTALALGFGLAAWQQRRRRIAESRKLAVLAGAVAEKEREIASLVETRENLGRDLHDNFMQSVYALGLSIEDCSQFVKAEPSKVEARLKNARLEINSMIRELRNVIVGLESNVIHPNELKAGLKSLALTLETDSNQILLQVEQGAIDALTPSQSTEIMHIAREAISNSIKHSKALSTMVKLRVESERIVLTVEDSGCGFDPAEPRQSGFGLRNMARRAESLGGTLSIRSVALQGTTIVLDIPMQKHHLSNRESHTPSNRRRP